jgi:hypothetical protein
MGTPRRKRIETEFDEQVVLNAYIELLASMPK